MTCEPRSRFARAALQSGSGLRRVSGEARRLLERVRRSAGLFEPRAGVPTHRPREHVAGLSILTRWTAVGSCVVMVLIVFIAFNLVTTGRFFDVAVRDVEMVIAAYTLARLTERARPVPHARPAIGKPLGASRQ